MQLNTQAGAVQIDTYPDRCPVCSHAIEPLDTQLGFINAHGLENVARCPRQQCGRFFIVRYRRPNPNSSLVFVFEEIVPFTVEISAQTEIIKGISPDFVAIFGEAEKAENLGLKLVCGPGYRKAIEFLIKDYVIKEHPQKTDEIKKLNLANCNC